MNLLTTKTTKFLHKVHKAVCDTNSILMLNWYELLKSNNKQVQKNIKDMFVYMEQFSRTAL